MTSVGNLCAPVWRLQVFDCWFESGSMPYAYIHYPFENKELFERNFPGHFVAEGLDQTRGWQGPTLHLSPHSTRPRPLPAVLRSGRKGQGVPC